MATPMAPNRSPPAAAHVGMEVVYEGIRFTPAEIAAQAKAANAHVVGLSILSGSHLDLVRETISPNCAPPGSAMCLWSSAASSRRKMPAPCSRWALPAVYTPKDFKITGLMSDVVELVEKAWL